MKTRSFKCITSNRKASRAIPAISCSASAREPYGSLMWTICSCKDKQQDELYCRAVVQYVLPSLQYVGFYVTYLHREPLSINGVLRPWSPITSPVEVKLGGSVVTRQTPSCQSDHLWQSKVGYREGRETVS